MNKVPPLFILPRQIVVCLEQGEFHLNLQTGFSSGKVMKVLKHVNLPE